MNRAQRRMSTSAEHVQARRVAMLRAATERVTQAQVDSFNARRVDMRIARFGVYALALSTALYVAIAFALRLP